MSRYFIEVAYHGKRYAGFQTQQNANTIQAEVEKALSVFFRSDFSLTGSSRTDAGVHALQNFFHFDTEIDLLQAEPEKVMYHLNAMLPQDIVVKGVFPKGPDDHCRFDAVSRTYLYRIYKEKDPFLADRAYYYPYALDLEQLLKAAETLQNHSDFQAFSKRSTQVHTFICELFQSSWMEEGEELVYKVEGNRFLRGMVRGLVGTMLLVGRGKLRIEDLISIIESKNSARVNFAVPAHGLTLIAVKY